MPPAPPTIFSSRRKSAQMLRGGVAGFLIEEMVEDIHERLAFLRHHPATMLIDRAGFSAPPGCTLSHAPAEYGQPFPGSFDLVASLATLDTANDLPGALIHMRELLASGGLAIATFIGGASLPALRRAMFEAEAERPAARMHPLIDPRSCPGLLSRAGWADPVVDTHRLTVRYSSLDRLVADLREQALGNVLASPAPPITRAALTRARAAFLDQADADGKVSETFEIITLTGRSPRR